MAKVLIVGCGDLGLAIADLLAERHAVFGLRRQASAGQPNITMLQGDVTAPASLQALHTLNPELIVYCVAADEQTDAAYQAQYVTGLAHVLATQRENRALRRVFFISSTRVYGQDEGEWLDESTPASPIDFAGQRLLEAEQLLQGLPCGATALRLSGLYGPGRFRMINMVMNQAWPPQNSWSNRIHRDDAAAFTAFLMEQVLAGQGLAPCYIVSDDGPAPIYEVLTYLAEQMQLAQPENWQQAAEGGKRLNSSLMQASGFKLRYPDYQAGYLALLLNWHRA